MITIDCDRELRLHLLEINLPSDEFSIYVLLIMLCIPLGKRLFNKQFVLNQGECVISQQRLTERTGLDRYGVQKALSSLQSKKLISVRKTEGFGCNIYRVRALSEDMVNIWEVYYNRLCEKKQRGESLTEEQQFDYEHLHIVYGKDFRNEW